MTNPRKNYEYIFSERRPNVYYNTDSSCPWPDSNKERKKGRNEGREKQTNKQTNKQNHKARKQEKQGRKLGIQGYLQCGHSLYVRKLVSFSKVRQCTHFFTTVTRRVWRMLKLMAPVSAEPRASCSMFATVVGVVILRRCIQNQSVVVTVIRKLCSRVMISVSETLAIKLRTISK